MFGDISYGYLIKCQKTTPGRAAVFSSLIFPPLRLSHTDKRRKIAPALIRNGGGKNKLPKNNAAIVAKKICTCKQVFFYLYLYIDKKMAIYKKI